MDECIFCKIIAGTMPCHKIYEDEKTLAFLDIFPNSEGHSLIIPKKHFENFEQTDDDYIQAVALAKKRVIKILKEKLPKKPVGFNYVSNQGAEAFQMVFHYHEHIIPKYIKKNGYTFVINKNSTDKACDEIYKAIIK